MKLKSIDKAVMEAYKCMTKEKVGLIIDRVRGNTVGEIIVKADILRKVDGSAPTAGEIFNYSSSGELSELFTWYPIALCSLYVNNFVGLD